MIQSSDRSTFSRAGEPGPLRMSSWRLHELRLWCKAVVSVDYTSTKCLNLPWCTNETRSRLQQFPGDMLLRVVCRDSTQHIPSCSTVLHVEETLGMQVCANWRSAAPISREALGTEHELVEENAYRPTLVPLMSHYFSRHSYDRLAVYSFARSKRWTWSIRS